MTKYVKLNSEFLAFVNAVRVQIIDPYEAKIINIILNHFDEIAEKGIAQGQRAQSLNQYIQSEGAKTSSELSGTTSATDSKTFPLKKINVLQISHFRGFSYEALTDLILDKKQVFIFGPNGSGKSSLCEAIEYSLLGYINEAINRRIEVSSYIKNKFSNKSATPILLCELNDGQIAQINSDPELYQFCFVEKNRIENFARISSSTPKDKQSRIASLFGLNEYNEFVKNFTPNFENKLDVVGKLNEQLSNKSAAIVVHRQNITRATASIQEKQDSIKELLANNAYDQSYENWNKSVFGEENKLGSLQNIESELAKPAVKKIDLPSESVFFESANNLRMQIVALKISCTKYLDSRSKVNFRDLFQAVKNLNNIIDNECPACTTPLEKTRRHPSEYAEEKLIELAQISEIELAIKTDYSLILGDYRAIELLINELIKTALEVGFEFELNPPAIPVSNSVEEVDEFIEAVSNLLDLIENSKTSVSAIASLVETRNKAADADISSRALLLGEKTKLNGLDAQIKSILVEINQHKENVLTWQTEVDRFDKENESLIKQAENEAPIIIENKKYLSAYNNFLTKLKKHIEELPAKYLGDLNQLTTDIYNEINQHDLEFEKAHSIILPKTADDSIFICFKNEPERPIDALDVLSEGHIKCLGLAILLAKNIHDGCPIIVFDDIVNAIDDDHRSGVRQLLLGDSRLSEKQMVLTTHSSQFIKELTQHHNSETHASTVLEYNFSLPPKNRGIIFTSGDTENYLLNAEKLFSKSKWPDVLSNCRRALENSATKLWKKLDKKKFKTDLTVIIRTPGGTPDLKSVIDAEVRLMKSLRLDIFNPIIESLDFFSGSAGESIIRWSYLNMGTHEQEERSEFDQSIVRSILDKLKLLDQQIKDSWTKPLSETGPLSP